MQLRLQIRCMLQWTFASYFNFMWWNYGLQTEVILKRLCQCVHGPYDPVIVAVEKHKEAMWPKNTWRKKLSFFIFKQVHWIAVHSATCNTRRCNSGFCVFLTCAGHHLGQLLELPNTRPCDHGKAWAHTLQRENLEKKNNFAKHANKQTFQFNKKTITNLQQAHILTSLGSWSTAFAWRRHLPLSHH